MKTLVQPNHRFFVASASAALALAAMGFAGAVKARDNVNISVGIGVPGVLIGANNAYPVYRHPGWFTSNRGWCMSSLARCMSSLTLCTINQLRFITRSRPYM